MPVKSEDMIINDVTSICNNSSNIYNIQYSLLQLIINLLDLMKNRDSYHWLMIIANQNFLWAL